MRNNNNNSFAKQQKEMNNNSNNDEVDTLVAFCIIGNDVVDVVEVIYSLTPTIFHTKKISILNYTKLLFTLSLY